MSALQRKSGRGCTLVMELDVAGAEFTPTAAICPSSAWG
jgi:hypothetical protein